MSDREASTAPRRAGSPDLALAHLDELPTLAPVAVRLLQATLQDDTDAAEIETLLRGDQSLTAKILSLANSSAYSSRGEVTTIRQAIVRLGFKQVRSITLAVKVFECFAPLSPAQKSRAFSRVEFWKHALGAACAARRLARDVHRGEIDPEEAFVAGLVHDIGKVALDCVFPKAYERIVSRAEETGGDLADAERAVLGIDHTLAGRHIAVRWGLPVFLQEVIWLHHLAPGALPSRCQRPDLIGLVQLADTLVREQRIGSSGNFAFYDTSGDIAARLGFDGQIDGVVRELAGDVSEQACLLGLERETPEGLYFKSLARANQELARLNADLVNVNRRLAAAARYFHAISRFDGQLGARLELAAVIAAIAEAARTALRREALVAFGLHDPLASVEVSWTTGPLAGRGSATFQASHELENALRGEDGLGTPRVMPAPRAVRVLCAEPLASLGPGELWLLPIAHAGQVVGGIVFSSVHDERSALREEAEELAPFLANLGLAIGRANAQAAAQRLSDDLAETNRRLQQMQAEVLRTRTISMIAEMAAGAGHELNNPLSVISGRAQMLMRDAPADSDTYRALEAVHQKAHECSRIVTDLMDFARPPVPKLEAVELLPLVNEVIEECRSQTGLPVTTLRLVAPPPPPARSSPALRVRADAAQLRTVVRELIDNAVDAISSTRGAIALECRPITPETAPQAAGLRRPAAGGPQRYVELTVRDTGCGMAASVLRRIFDPFYSHRRAGRGRGLGLARAYRIIEAHEGRVWYESQPDQGTTAHVALPEA